MLAGSNGSPVERFPLPRIAILARIGPAHHSGARIGVRKRNNPRFFAGLK